MEWIAVIFLEITGIASYTIYLIKLREIISALRTLVLALPIFKSEFMYCLVVLSKIRYKFKFIF